jgi:hypothetical protein
MSMELFALAIIIGICATVIAIVAYLIGKSKGYSEGYERGHSLTPFTAERAREVRDLIERHWHDLAEEYGMGPCWSSAHPEDDYDWQAIADGLNEMLGIETRREAADEDAIPF